jgi:acetyltransferase-like isoleucine patch superfamily enzyme
VSGGNPAESRRLASFATGRISMMITERSKRVIPFRPNDAKRVGEGCFYLDLIVWLNGDRIELGERVGFNYGCYVNGYGGLRIGDRTRFGPYAMVHTANHEMAPDLPLVDQGWTEQPVEIGVDCWIGMGACVLPGARVGDGCIVGAGSVVVGELEGNCIAVGNPARPKKSR